MRFLSARTPSGPYVEALRLPYRWLLRQEAVVLVVALVIVVALTSFVELAEELREGEMRSFTSGRSISLAAPMIRLG